MPAYEYALGNTHMALGEHQKAPLHFANLVRAAKSTQIGNSQPLIKFCLAPNEPSSDLVRPLIDLIRPQLTFVIFRCQRTSTRWATRIWRWGSTPDEREETHLMLRQGIRLEYDSSQGQNLAVTVSCVTNSVDKGLNTHP